MKILFVVPADKTRDVPLHVPIQTAILARIADQAGHKLDVLDLNALREVRTNEAVLECVKDEEKKATFQYDLVWVESDFYSLPDARRIVDTLKPKMPKAVFALGGDAADPHQLLGYMHGLDLVAFGERELTFAAVTEQTLSQRWEDVDGIAYRAGKGTKRNPGRDPQKSDSVPFPNYLFVQMPRYFQFSGLPICAASMQSKRRLSFSWQRESFSEEMQKTVVRLPSPKRAVNQILSARERYCIDFAYLMDRDLTTDAKWMLDFINAYMEAGVEHEGLHDVLPWSCWVDPGQVNRNPELVRRLKDGGCVAAQVEAAPDSIQAIKDATEHFTRSGIPLVVQYPVGSPDQSPLEVLEMIELASFNPSSSFEVKPPDLAPSGRFFKGHRSDILRAYGGDVERFLFDEAPNWPYNFRDTAVFAAAMQARDPRPLLEMMHASGRAHDPKWKPKCMVCKLQEGA